MELWEIEFLCTGGVSVNERKGQNQTSSFSNTAIVSHLLYFSLLQIISGFENIQAHYQHLKLVLFNKGNKGKVETTESLQHCINKYNSGLCQKTRHESR